MIIEEKYNYKILNRVDSPTGRRYVLPNGVAVPSVTTILSKTADTSFIDQWRNDVGEEHANKIIKESTDLGTAIHKLLEDYILGKPLQGQYMSKTLANLIIKKGMVNVGVIYGAEVPLYCTDLYAGTADAIGLHKNVPTIIDFKNSRQKKSKEDIQDYFLQLAAYSIAHNEMYGTSIGKGVIMMAVRDGTYLEFIVDGDEFEEYKVKWLNRVYDYYENYVKI